MVTVYSASIGSDACTAGGRQGGREPTAETRHAD